jgi:hypothetical protein
MPSAELLGDHRAGDIAEVADFFVGECGFGVVAHESSACMARRSTQPLHIVRQADQLRDRIQRNIVRKRPLIDLWQGA